MYRVAAITLIALSGCAAPNAAHFQGGTRLETGLHVEAPAGALDYCRRAPDECGVLVAGLRGRIAPTGAARLDQSQAPAPSLFHALMLQRAAAGSRSQAGPRTEVALTDARLRELFRINRQVNRSIGAATDFALYGADEHWVRPLQLTVRGARGDCEDYALEKRAMLIASGWPAEALAMAVAISPRVGLHAVLIVQTDRGDIALDNLFDRPMPVDQLGYHWISRQASASLGEWTSAHLSNGERASAPRPSGAAERFHAMLEARARRDGAMREAPSVFAANEAPALQLIAAPAQPPALASLAAPLMTELDAPTTHAASAIFAVLREENAAERAEPKSPAPPVRLGKPNALAITHRLMRTHLEP